MESDTEAYSGLSIARELSVRTSEIAKRNNEKDTPADSLLNAALREAEVGNVREGRESLQSENFTSLAGVKTGSLGHRFLDRPKPNGVYSATR